ncbi:hypothetical protein QQP08_007427 [Theobroma cacao]|nr:hypothetical protein QQP08_007427 [Theobroma cacao]
MDHIGGSVPAVALAQWQIELHLYMEGCRYRLSAQVLLNIDQSQLEVGPQKLECLRTEPPAQSPIHPADDPRRDTSIQHLFYDAVTCSQVPNLTLYPQCRPAGLTPCQYRSSTCGPPLFN